MTHLKAYLTKAGSMTQAALAKELNVSEAYVSLLADGKRMPSRGLAAKIETATEGQVSRLNALYPFEENGAST